MKSSERKAIGTVGAMVVIALIGKIMGLARDMYFNYEYGIKSMESIAFTSASKLPTLFLDAMFASAISASFIPVFNEYMEKEGKERAFLFSHNFLTIILLVSSLVTVLGIIGAGPLVEIYVSGLDTETKKLTVQLLRIMFPMLVASGLAFSLTGILQSLDEFKIPSAMSIVSNGAILLYYLLFVRRFGIYGLALAYCVSWFLQFFMQVPSLWKKGYRYHPVLRPKEEGIQKVGKLMLPVMVSTWIMPLNVTINTAFASYLYEGAAVSAMNSANQIYTIVVGVFTLSVANLIFPHLSRLSTKGDAESFGSTVGISLKGLLFILIPVTAGMMALSEPLVRILFQRGNFDAFSTTVTARALFFYAPGMVGYGLQSILNRGFYAKKDGKTPLFAGVASIGMNIGLSFLLIKPMDVGGLALAATASSWMGGLILLAVMGRKYQNMVDRNWIIDIIKMTVSAICMYAAVWVIRTGFWQFGSSLAVEIAMLGVAAIIGAGLYEGITLKLGLTEARTALSFLKKIGRKS